MTPTELCNPDAVRVCLAVARRFYPAVRPCDRDELRSAALYGLAHAARSFDPVRFPNVPFVAYASAIAKRYCIHAVRDLRPFGYRSTDKAPPSHVAWDFDLEPGREHPVGWELESEEEVRALAARLESPGQREALLARFLLASDKPMAERLGLRQAGVECRHTAAMQTLRGALRRA